MMQASDVMVCCKLVRVTSIIGMAVMYVIALGWLTSSVPIFQFHHPALLVMSDLLMETVRWRGGSRCAEVECGELFMTTVDGTSMLHKSHVDNWDILLSVS